MGTDEPAKPAPVVLRIKVRYEHTDAFVERFAPYVGRAGLFLRSKTPKAVGTEVRFELRLATDAPVLVGMGIVRWARGPDPARPTQPPGMAIEFTRVTKESRGVILQMLELRKKLAMADGPRGMPNPPDDDAALTAAATASAAATAIAIAAEPVLSELRVEGISGPTVVTSAAPKPMVAAQATIPHAAPPPPAPSSWQRPPMPGTLDPIVAKPRRPSAAELVAMAMPATSAIALGDAFGDLDIEQADLPNVLARARTLVGADADSELARLLDADAAPTEITIEEASARLASLLGTSPVRSRKHRGDDSVPMKTSPMFVAPPRVAAAVAAATTIAGDFLSAPAAARTSANADEAAEAVAAAATAAAVAAEMAASERNAAAAAIAAALAASERAAAERAAAERVAAEAADAAEAEAEAAAAAAIAAAEAADAADFDGDGDGATQTVIDPPVDPDRTRVVSLDALAAMTASPPQGETRVVSLDALAAATAVRDPDERTQVVRVPQDPSARLEERTTIRAVPTVSDDARTRVISTRDLDRASATTGDDVDDTLDFDRPRPPLEVPRDFEEVEIDQDTKVKSRPILPPSLGVPPPRPARRTTPPPPPRGRSTPTPTPFTAAHDDDGDDDDDAFTPPPAIAVTHAPGPVIRARADSSGSIDITDLVAELEVEAAQPVRPINPNESGDFQRSIGGEALDAEGLIAGLGSFGRRPLPDGPFPDLADFADPPSQFPRRPGERAESLDAALAALEGEDDDADRSLERTSLGRPSSHPGGHHPPFSDGDDDESGVEIEIEVDD